MYFNILKFKLHQHPPAQFEHFIHTFRGVLFIPIAVIFFVWNSAGIMLWIGLWLLVIDLIAEVVDILVEKNSRAELGGISPTESVIHVTATGFRMVALSIVIAMKPLHAISFSTSTSELTLLPTYLTMTGSFFICGVGIALLLQIFMSCIDIPTQQKNRLFQTQMRLCCLFRSQ